MDLSCTTAAPGDLAWTADIVARMLSDGAMAVALVGSAARGDAHPESDIDLLALGDGPEYRLWREGGRLISESWRTPNDALLTFSNPREAGYVVPGWRGAVVLADPHGVASSIIESARKWTWEWIGDTRCDAWVAEELTGYAEEVHKLVVALECGALTTAAVQRSVLGLRSTQVIAVHLRLLYDSENQLWDLVGSRMGEPWATAQHQALAIAGESLVETCRAALTLYRIASETTMQLFDERQRAVVEHALVLAGSLQPE